MRDIGVALLICAALVAAGDARAAGNVTVQVKGGKLVLVGDAASNWVRITRPGDYLVAPNDGDTLINGGSAPVPFVASKGIVAKLGAGSDSLQIEDGVPGSVEYSGSDTTKLILHGAAVQGSVRFKGSGSTTTGLGGGSVVSGKLDVRGGSGPDFLDIVDGSGVQGATSLNAGDGGTTVLVDASVLQKTLKVSARDGFDSVTLANGADVAGLDLKLGDGQSLVQVQGGSAVGGNLRIRSGRDFDNLLLDSSLVTGNVQVKAGPDQSLATFQNAIVEGQVQLKHGSDFDNVSIAATNIAGKLTVKNGPGQSLFTVASGSLLESAVRLSGSGYVNAQITDSVTQSSVKIDAGKDGALFGFGASGISTIGGDLSLRTKAGPFVVQLERLVVEGRTRIRGGGDDLRTVMIDDSSFEGPLAIQTGKGDDTISVETDVSPTGFPTSLMGKVAISTGDGDDVVTIGNDDTDSTVTFDDALSVNGGKGNDTLDHETHGNSYAVPPKLKSIESEL